MLGHDSLISGIFLFEGVDDILLSSPDGLTRAYQRKKLNGSYHYWQRCHEQKSHAIPSRSFIDHCFALSLAMMLCSYNKS